MSRIGAWMTLLITFGSAAGGSINVPADFATIQAAIDAAEDGDIVVVAPGVYGEAIDLGGKAITVRSAAGFGATTIDASGLELSVVRCVTGETRDTLVEGFTIIGGIGMPGIDGVHRGGGLLITDASPVISACRILNNTAAVGGGAVVEGGAPRFEACELIANFAGNLGGGLALIGADAEVVDCCFIANVGSNGGGLAVDGAAPAITGCRFAANMATNGGGVHTDESAARLSDCAFEGNLATQGGGMQTTAGGPIVRRCTYVQNVASQRGGGLAVTSASIVVAACRFLGNEADGIGGGLWTFNTTLDLVNAAFSGNEAVFGGAIGSESGGSILIQQCSLTGNSAFLAGGVFAAPGTVPTILNSILWGDGGGEIDGDATVEQSNVLGGYPGANVIDAPPGFVDAPGPDGDFGTLDDDLRVVPGAIGNDRGRNDLVPPDRADLDGDGDVDEPTPLDLAGGARFADDPAAEDAGFGTPPFVDQGAYELQSTAPADINGDGVVDVDDLIAVLLAWGPCPAPCPEDIDGSGVVDVDDLIAVLLGWTG